MSRTHAAEDVAGLRTVEMDYLYGRYRIISGFKDGQYHAHAYTGSRLISRFTADTLDAANERLKNYLYEHMEELKAQRDEEGIPSVEEYREALEAMGDDISRQQIKTLRAYAQTYGDKITIKDLIQDEETLEETDALYARVGRTLSIFLDFKPHAEELPAKLKPIHVIAIPQGHSEGLWEWNLRPQVIEALRQAKI